jgi:UDP-N-acetylmuramate--alanine ligase
MDNIHIRDYKGKHVHFIGIGGISMSGLAEILHEKGYRISGSDLQPSPITESLMHKGMTIYKGHSADNIQGAELVVYTAAVKDDNPELVEAKKRNIPAMDRATLLGQIMDTYQTAIGVSGTHGKTTTTSMLALVMHESDLDPTILVGGQLDEIGGNVRTGNSDFFITEACEYVDSFLKFRPNIALILNIESDHLDYFKDIDHIYSSFVKYARLVPTSGYVIGCGDDPLVSKLLAEVDCNTISYGIDRPADWTAREITYDNTGCASFIVMKDGHSFGRFELKVPGRHNVYNALATIAASHIMGIPADKIKNSLLKYHGTHRRFERKGTTENKAVLIDDYAHHPTEIKTTINAALNYPHNKLWCIFQPHTYTRTKMLFNDFIEAFEGVDQLIITDIYAAREKDTGEIHSRMLADAIAQKGHNCIYISSFEEIIEYVKNHSQPEDLIITMGAGSIYKVGEALLGNRN